MVGATGIHGGTAVGRADLLRTLGSQGEGAMRQLAEQLGFREEIEEEELGPDVGLQRTRAQAEPKSATPAATAPLTPTPFWRPERVEFLEEPSETSGPKKQAPPGNLDLASLRPKGDWPETAPIVPWSRLGPALHRALRSQVPSRKLDARRLVELWSRGEVVEKLPRRPTFAWSRRLTVLLDRNRRLVPFWADQEEVVGRLQRILGRSGLRTAFSLAGPSGPWLQGRSKQSLTPTRMHGDTVLVISDLGSYGEVGEQTSWYRWLHALRRCNVHLHVLLPCPAARWSPFARRWNSIDWARPQRGRGSSWTASTGASLGSRRDELLTLASPMLRLEPGLLRDLRRLLSASKADIGTEADVWNHREIRSRSSVALSLPRHLAQRFREHFRGLPEALQDQVVQALRRWRRASPLEIWCKEVLGLTLAGQQTVPGLEEAEVLEARKLEQSVAQALVQPSGLEEEETEGVKRFFFRTGLWLPEQVWQDEELRPWLARAWAVASQDVEDAPVPAGLTPADLESLQEGEAERDYELRLVGELLVVRPAVASPGLPSAEPGSPVVRVKAARRFLHLGVREERKLPLPPWAIDGGEDRYGRWAAFEVEGIRVRMRWIPPGTFLMGSPEDKEGRDEDEGPQHQVTLSRGYWLAEVPTTQDLWQAVTSGNPSHFQGPRRPVEQVSWDDCQQFLVKLNECVAGLRLRLPTEAEWEYACRAGTEASRYRSELEAIAWYRANSRDGTQEVGQKAVNAWGLYDTLGNVNEWCQDWKSDFSAAAATDPQGSEEGSARVFRGGSWIDFARFVRAASRSWHPPGSRHNDLGVRLAQDQEEPAEPKKRAGETEAEQGAGRAGDAGDLERERGDEKLWQRIPLGSDPSKVALPKAPAVIITSDRQRVELRRFTRPEWASAAGRDRFGLWAAFEVGKVEVRMRWIPPGRFWMGSPESEEGRLDREGPQHLVTWTRGFWMGEFPVTQDLWQEVTGENPSHFQSDRRPVEQVSWDDCQEFVSKLNQTRSGLALRLPSEAEWEYACRAGAQTATYAGDLEIKGQPNAPLLDSIGWYGGNCAHGFDLEGGFDLSSWEGKQYPEKKGGTRIVGLKQVNPCGLYDMLGNVEEWCTDSVEAGAGYSSAEPRVDPEPSSMGSYRVIRGGSWIDDARYVRAAYRYRLPPGLRNYYLGVRLAQDQDEPAEPK